MKRERWVTWIVSMGVLGLPLSVWGQGPEGPATGSTTTEVRQPVKPRSALQSGIEAYTKGEYEVADALLRQAEANGQALSQQEQGRLQEYLRRNNDALKGRMLALEQYQKATEAVNSGRTQEADSLLKALKSNKYLHPSEQAGIAELSDMNKQKTAKHGFFERRNAMKKDADADATLAEARKCLERGDYENAQMLAQEAKKSGHHAVLPWSDTPDKVLKECQAAHNTKTSSTNTAKTPVNLDAKSAGARELLVQAHHCVEAGDMLQARRLVKQAEDMKPNIPWYDEYAPDKVKSEIVRAEAGVNRTNAASRDGQAMAATKTTTPAEAKGMVKQARTSLEQKNYDQAEELAKRARLVTTVKWGLFEDTPDRVLSDIAKERESANGEKAIALLGEARKQMDQGQYDEAERLTYQAETLRREYPIWHRGDRPASLRAEIVEKRRLDKKPRMPSATEPTRKTAATTPGAKNSPWVEPPPASKQVAADPKRQQAQQLLVQARVHLNNGDVVLALDLARQVKEMNVTLQPGDDTPESLVASVRMASGKAASVPPGSPDVMRQKALVHLNEARLMQKEGRLLDALQAVEMAKKCNAAFQPMDETPDKVYIELQKTALAQVDTYSAAAQTLVKRNQPADAEKYLRYVHSVSVAFAMDTQAVTQQLATLQLQTTGQADLPADIQGVKLLEQARAELKKGELVQARKLAEAVYTGPYAKKEDASKLLAELDAAEHKLNLKRAQFAYDAGVQAYRRKDYAVCAGYLQSIDLRLLDERKKSHAQEILASKELQPSHLMQVAHQVPSKADASTDTPGKATATDQTPVTKSSDEPKKGTLVEEVQTRQRIELQKLREQARQAQIQASRMSVQGNWDGALESLENAMAAVKASTLEPEQVSPLQRQLETRIRQYTTMKEQVAFTKLQEEQLSTKNNAARQKLLAEEGKKEQVAELMKKHINYMDDGKYKEAELVAMKAHEMDPSDATSEMAALKARMMLNVSSADKNKQLSNDGVAYQLNQVAKAGAPPTSDYEGGDKDAFDRRLAKKGKKWEPLKRRTPEDIETEAKLNSVISVDFKNRPLSDVLEELRQQVGINMTFDKPNIDGEAISLQQPVDVKLGNVQAKRVLDSVLKNAQLAYSIKHGIVEITTPRGREGTVQTQTYPVANLVNPVPNFGAVGSGYVSTMSGQLKAVGADAASNNNMEWSMPGTSVVGQASSTSQSMANSPGAQMQSHPKSKRSELPMEDILMDLIRSTVEPSVWDTNGGAGHIEYFPLGMTLVVSQVTPDIQQQVELLLDRLRELQELQVTVEVRFLTLTENFYERIGIDFDMEINDKQTRFDNMVATNRFAPPGFINEPDHLDNVIVGLTPTGNLTTDLDIPIENSSFSLATPLFGGFPNSPGNNGGLSMGVAFLTSIEAFLLVEAAQGDTRSNVVQAPKLTLFNGQVANLTSLTTQLFVVNVVPNTNPFTGITTFVPVNQPFPSGIFLTLQAVVTADRRYVQLSLAPSITNTTAGGFFEPIPGLRLQQPVQSTLSVATTVQVPDGGTILMGGLKTMQESRNEFGPPILSKLPYINRLFRNQSYGKHMDSLMMMVTPRIIIPEEEEERLAQTFAF